MLKFEQPPIGIAPHWFINQKRIEEISDGIARYVKYAKDHHHEALKEIEIYELIHRWAFELSELSKLEVQLLKKDRIKDS